MSSNWPIFTGKPSNVPSMIIWWENFETSRNIGGQRGSRGFSVTPGVTKNSKNCFSSLRPGRAKMKVLGRENVQRDLDLPLDPVSDLPTSFNGAWRDVPSEVWFGWLGSTEGPCLWAVDHTTNTTLILGDLSGFGGFLDNFQEVSVQPGLAGEYITLTQNSKKCFSFWRPDRAKMKILGRENVQRDLDLPLDPVNDLPFSFGRARRNVWSEVRFGCFEPTERPGFLAVDHPTNMPWVHKKNCNHGQTHCQ